MSIDLSQFQTQARAISGEHRDAISKTEQTAKEKARASNEYHKRFAVQIAMAKQEFGATLAEKLAKGHSEVIAAAEALAIAEAEDRAAMERIRLARDDRNALLAIAGWSRANEAVE